MGFEANNFNPASRQNRQKTPDVSSLKEKFPKFIKKSILLAAISIASYWGYDKFYGGNDYSSVGSFTKAFKAAREHDEKVFRWNGKKFTTDLVDKEFSDNYWESKKFLEDYYSSEYFKNERKLTPMDTFTVRYPLQQNHRSNSRYKELDARLMDGPGLTESEMNEYEQLDKLAYGDSIYATPEFKEKMDSLQSAEGVKRLENLKESTPFFITHQKGDRHEDGLYQRKTKQVYVYKGKNSPNETTSVHELTHKSSKANEMLISNGTYTDLYERAYNSVKSDRNFIRKHGQKGFDYLSDPTEIDARQNSTRFWLFKHFPNYKADTVFTAEHFKFLKKNYDNLPYDIQQLLDLFPSEDTFVFNMNTY